MSQPDVVIAGVGMTRFTRQPQRGYDGLVVEAATTALDHAGVSHTDIGAAFCSSIGIRGGFGQRTLKHVGLAGIPMVNVENACASGSTAVREAYAWVKAGFVDCALAVGADIVSELDGPLPMPDDWVGRTGLNLPGWYALKARRHMDDYGLTREQLAAVTVKSRGFARLNPYAHLRTPTTVAEVLGSRMIADPLTLFQCCPKVDGAAAAVVCSAEFARSRGLSGAVGILGQVMASGVPVYTNQPYPDTATRTADAAWEVSGVGPLDVDVVECHDAFTIGEILYTEALGLCPKGEGGKVIAGGATSLGGDRAVVNPSGGLLSRGHPLGASGIAQIAEVVWHLRDEAGDRQVPDARLGVVHTMGANDFELDANACVVTVLSAPTRRSQT